MRDKFLDTCKKSMRDKFLDTCKKTKITILLIIGLVITIFNFLKKNGNKLNPLKKIFKHITIIFLILLPIISFYFLNENIDYINGVDPKLIGFFIGVLIVFTIIEIIGVILLSRINNHLLFISLPFLIIYVLFFLFLFLGIFYYNIFFFMNDFMNIINPYLMTYGFLFYGALLGISFSEKDTENILLLSNVIIVYLVLLLFFHFSYNYFLNSNKNHYFQKNNINSEIIDPDYREKIFIPLKNISGISNLFSEKEDKIITGFISSGSYSNIGSYLECYNDYYLNKDIKYCIHFKGLLEDKVNEPIINNSNIDKLHYTQLLQNSNLFKENYNYLKEIDINNDAEFIKVIENILNIKK